MSDKKKLRFAPLIRVSTEKTKLKGESLKLQLDDIESFVEEYGGVIPEDCRCYIGNEHATPEHERAILELLLNDSRKNKYDAVIVYDPSRWSRDNLKSKQGLKILRANGRRFFASGQEYDLFNPDHTHLLGMAVEQSEHQALTMQRKSIIGKIDRNNFFALWMIGYHISL